MKQRGYDAWKGPLHMRVAANRARQGDLDAARVQLELAEAWLRRWSALDEHDRSSWRLDAEDAAAFAEAAFYLYGPDAAAVAAQCWRPSTFALRVSELLVERLAGGPGRTGLAGHIANRNLPIEIEARLLAVLFQNGGSTSASELERVCRKLIEEPPAEHPEHDESWRLELIEHAASIVDDTVLLDLIQALRPTTPAHIPNTDLGEWETPLRLACLETVITDTKLDVESLLPERLTSLAEADTDQRRVNKREKERKKLLKLLDKESHLYLLRASCVSRRMHDYDIVTESLKILESFAKHAPYYRHEYEWFQRFERTTIALFDSLCVAEADLATPYDKLLTITPGNSLPLAMWLDLAETMLRRGTHTSWAANLIDHVVRETQKLDEPPTIKAERLVRCAALVDPIDRVHAADYYSEAITASSGLDEERARVLHLMNHLADSLPESHNQEASVLATRLRQAVEQFRPFVHDPRDLPWMKTLETITALNPDAGVRTLTLWDELGELRLEDGVVAVSKVLATRGAIDVITALQLLWLMSESNDCTRPALEMLDRAVEAQTPRSVLTHGVGWLGERIARHMTLEVRLSGATNFANWIETNGFENAPWAGKILAIREMSMDLPDPSQRVETSRAWNVEARNGRQRRIAELIALASGDHPEDLEHRLEQFSEEWASSKQVSQYLSMFGTRISPHLRIPAIEAICQLQPDAEGWRRNALAIVEGLALWISLWGTTSSVRNWSRKNLRSFFLDRFPSIVGFDHEQHSSLVQYLMIDALDNPAELLLDATSRHLHILNPAQLILIAKSLSDHMPEDNRLDVLTWILGELIEDEEFPDCSLSGTDGDQSLSDLLWALLGHPDKNVRWRATHLLLDRSRRSSTFINSLIRNFDDKTGLGFFAATSTFLWMSAQVWLLLTLRPFGSRRSRSTESIHADASQDCS